MITTITPVQALRALWVKIMPSTDYCDIPDDSVFVIWLRTAPYEEVTKSISKSSYKFKTLVATGAPMLGRTAPARYVSSIVGAYRKRVREALTAETGSWGETL